MKDDSQVHNLCKRKGKLPFAEMQKTVSRASGVGRGPCQELRVDVRFEVPLRHPTEAVKKTDT